MNAAQAVQVARLYDRPDLLTPFRQRGLLEQGEHLAEMVLNADDRGHASDVVAVNTWAAELSLTGWFEWHRPTISR